MYSHIDCWKQAQKTVDHVGVSKNRGTPKWMVFFHGKPYEQMDDLGGKHPYFRVDTHLTKS